MEAITVSAQQLAEDHMRLVPYIVHKHCSSTRGMLDEYISAGYLGLTKAAQSYDPAFGTKFNSYAGVCISNEIRTVMRRERKHDQTISLDIEIEGEDGTMGTLLDLIPDPDADPGSAFEVIEVTDRLHSALQKLPERDRYLLQVYYGFGFQRAKTQSAMAKDLGVSRAYVSILRKRALSRLGEIMEIRKEHDQNA